MVTINENGVIEGRIPGVRDNKVYNDAISKDVESYVLYTKREDDGDFHYAYKDQACTEMVSCDEMREMFIKGVIVISGDGHMTGGAAKGLFYGKAAGVQIVMPTDTTEHGDVRFGIIDDGFGNTIYSKEHLELSNNS